MLVGTRGSELDRATLSHVPRNGNRYIRPICHTFAVRSFSSVWKYIGSVHSWEPNFNITCGIEGCPKAKEERKISQQALDGLIEDFDELYETRQSCLRDKIKKCLLNLDSSVNVIEAVDKVVQQTMLPHFLMVFIHHICNSNIFKAISILW